MTLTCWRIVPAEQATTAFDGEGARLNGGRWNSIGVAMAYASEHKSLAALEVRVHIEATRKIKRYKSFAFHFDESLVEWLRTAELPQNWQQEPPPSALQQLGDAWVASAKSPILAVPSIVIPDELNYLLNPKHQDFGKIKIDKPSDFSFDPRLLK